MAPLLTGISPAIIRTISVRMDFIPAVKARAKARADTTSDGGKDLEERQLGKVSDGSSEMMLQASRQRMQDLRWGTTHHGVDWSLGITVTAESEKALHHACRVITTAANNCTMTRLVWQDTFHDAAQIASYPLGRGH
jgi:hypothetical protein